MDEPENAFSAVLSQHQGPKALMHRVVFFSYKLTPAEKNSDVGDWELMAIKTSIEE